MQGMDTPQMTAMGMKRGDMQESPAAKTVDKDWDNEMVYPTLNISGKQAENFGAESLEDGECVQQTVVWRVKKTTIERDGKTNYELTLELVKASDPVACEDESADEDAGESGESDDEPSPGLAYILKGAGR